MQAFRSRKEVIKAQYSAAQAQVRIGSALSGLSEEMGDISLAIERAENKTEAMRAKAGAIDELAAAGVLDDPMGGKDDLDTQLESISASAGVEAELAALRGDVPGQGTKIAPGGTVMIVRILTEGQYDLPGAFVDELNSIDNRLVEIVETGKTAKSSTSSSGLCSTSSVRRAPPCPSRSWSNQTWCCQSPTSRSRRPKSSLSARA